MFKHPIAKIGGPSKKAEGGFEPPSTEPRLSNRGEFRETTNLAIAVTTKTLHIPAAFGLLYHFALNGQLMNEQ